MFISTNSHDLIVEELHNRIAALDFAHDLVVAELRNQIVELKSERDFYRKEWTRSRGKAFTTKADAEPSMPLFNQPPTPFDADWTSDDRDLFHRWSIDLPPHVDAEEEWRRLYGGASPLIALTV